MKKRKVWLLNILVNEVNVYEYNIKMVREIMDKMGKGVRGGKGKV